MGEYGNTAFNVGIYSILARKRGIPDTRQGAGDPRYQSTATARRGGQGIQAAYHTGILGINQDVIS